MAKHQSETTAWRLFHRPIKIEMLNKFQFQRGQLEYMVGFTDLPDKNREEFLNDYSQLSKTTVQLAYIYDSGLPFNILYVEDLVLVDELITEHLANWANIINDQLSGIKPPPAEDFILLKNLQGHLKVLVDKFKPRVLKPATSLATANGLVDFNTMFGGYGSSISTGLDLGSTIETEIRSKVEQNNPTIEEAWDNSVWGVMENGDI